MFFYSHLYFHIFSVYILGIQICMYHTITILFALGFRNIAEHSIIMWAFQSLVIEPTKKPEFRVGFSGFQFSFGCPKIAAMSAMQTLFSLPLGWVPAVGNEMITYCLHSDPKRAQERNVDALPTFTFLYVYCWMVGRRLHWRCVTCVFLRSWNTSTILSSRWSWQI